MVLVKSKIGSHVLRNLLAVARQHHGMSDAKRLQLRNCRLRIRLLNIRDVNMSRIHAIYCHVNDGASLLAALPLCSDGIHHFAVADADCPAVYNGPDALSRNLLHALHRAAIRFVSKCRAKRYRDRVRGIALHMRCQMQQLLLIHFLRVERCHLKDTLCQRSRLVKDNRIRLCQRIHVAGALDQDSCLRCCSDSSEEHKRYGNHQCAGARYNQEGQRTQKPDCKASCKISRQHRRNERQCNGCKNHDRCVNSGKSGDELLTSGFLRACMLYKIQDLRCRRFAKLLFHSDAKNAALIDAAGQNRISRCDISGNTFACQCHGIKTGCTLQNNAVHRNLLTGPDHDGFPDRNLLRADDKNLSLTLHICRIRPDVQKLRNGTLTVALCNSFKQLADLEEQHDKNRLGKLLLSSRHKADQKCSDCRNAHQEIFIKNLSLTDVLGGLLQNIEACCRIRDQENQELLPHGKLRKGPGHKNRRNQENGRYNNLNELLLRLHLLFFLFVLVLLIFLLADLSPGLFGFLRLAKLLFLLQCPFLFSAHGDLLLKFLHFII